MIATLCALFVLLAAPAAGASAGGPELGGAAAGGEASLRAAYLHFLLAKHALAEDDYPTAIDEFLRARDLDPKSAVVRLELAEVYLRLRRYKDAAREAIRASELAPDNQTALELVAQIHELTGDLAQALTVLRRLSEAEPEQAGYLVQMASIEDRAGHATAAVALLEEAVRRDPKALEAVFSLVEKFQGMGRLDKAIEVLNRTAEVDPQNLYVQSRLVELSLQIRDVSRARLALDRMVQVAPANVHVLLEVARAYRQLEDDRRAAQLYRRALELKDDDGIRVNLATALTRSGDYKGALVEYRLLLKSLEGKDATRNPERFEFLRRIGLIELELGNVEPALASLEQACAHTPQLDLEFVRVLARAYDLAGKPGKGCALLDGLDRDRYDNGARTEIEVQAAACRMLAGKVSEGLASYRKLREERNLDERQHGFVAHAALRAGQEQAAEDALRQAVKQEPAEERRIYMQVAGLLFEARRKDLGFALVEKLIGRYPDDRDLYLRLAQLHAREQDRPAGIQVLLRAVKLFPEDAEIRFQLGANQERFGQFEAARRELARAIELEPGLSIARNYLAYMLAERGEELELALGHAERAVEAEPDNGAFLDTLGWVYFKLGRLPQAQIQLQRAVEAVGDDPVVRDHLGDVLLGLGDLEGALREFRRAAQLDGAGAVSGLGEKIERVEARLTRQREGGTAPATPD